ncbi:hypothetical protein ACM66B_003077 [Microbotryomycetes sp. NB124-2]
MQATSKGATASRHNHNVESVLQNDERRRLLGDSTDDATSHLPTAPLKSSTSQFPWMQILTLCFMRMVEPVANTLIYPFIADQLMWIGVTDKPEKLGYYAGIIEGLFAFATFTTILTWGRLSDKIGRKPVLMIGLSGVAISTLAFGFSTTFAALIVSRTLGGALNGNVAVIKSMIGELTDSTTQARAFSILPLSWSLGSVMGPMLGGFLANPAKHHPSVYKGTLFEAFPYALPCIVGALFPVIGVIVASTLLKETLTAKIRTETVHPKAVDEIRGRSKYGSTVSSTVAATTEETDRVVGQSQGSSQRLSTTNVEEPASGDVEVPSLRLLFRSRRVLTCLLVYACLALQTIAMDAIFVLFCYSDVSLGGIGFSEQSIGQALALGGALTVTLQLVVFPPLQARFGTTKLYRALMLLYPTCVFPMFLLMSRVAKKSSSNSRDVWLVMIVFLFVKSLANCSYACNMMSITDATPHRSLLGSLNGLAQMLASLCRSVGPMAASSLFALSKTDKMRHVLGGQLVIVIMIGFSALGWLSTLWLVDAPAEWRQLQEQEEVRRT